MVLQSLEAHRLRLYGPCRDLTAATELKAGTLAAIAAWYLSHTTTETGNKSDKTIGKTVSRDEIRACCLLTAVTWLSSAGRKAHWCCFKLLCIKAFSLYAFYKCRRSVLTQHIMMVNLWVHPDSS
ncbi:g8147 [Coccomyxa viridis]|uniref:G8147 protein n=1 Tax=Coccomyxa viridis TaxID=1274662 RepID=A0ABP1G261_9CHLO